MNERYFSTFQLILISLFAALIVAAKVALKMPLGMPGHSGVFWMAIVATAVGIINKPGAASLVGVTSGLLAAFLGMGGWGALNTFLSYTAVGVGFELAHFLLPDLENPAIAGLAAALGHMGKFLVKWMFGVVTGVPVGFVALGLMWAMVGYIVFGAIGGVLGSLTLRVLKQAGFFTYLAEKR